ncbi:MAG: AMP-binding protein [Sphingomonadaceae bacterium]|nr:AMP-binding protein [Sphingomonadaceae bacterium]
MSDTRDRNLGRVLQMQADAVGDDVYLLSDDRRITFAETDRKVNSIARGLADLGVGRGDRVAFFANSAIEIIFLTLAISRLGAVWIPINAEYKGEWLRSTLIDSQPTVIVSDTRLFPRLAEVLDDVPYKHLVLRDIGFSPMPPNAKPFGFLESFSDAPHDMSFIDYGDVNAVLWTSGTTGKSKGVMQSHNVWLYSAERTSVRYGTIPGDITYNVLPLYNTASWIMTIFRALFEGIGCATDPTFSATEFWNRTRFYNATQTFTLGAMHIYLWKQPERADDSDNPVRSAGMTPMPDEIIEPFCKRFGIERIAQGFGQSEFGNVISREPTTKPGLKLGALGKVSSAVKLRLINDDGNDVPDGEAGEFALKPEKPHIMFEGYFENPEASKAAFTADGWYRMGDLGRRDADGDYFFVDRKKDAVRLAGRNISTMEVEKAIRGHPAVNEVAVFGIRSEVLDVESELAAHVILNEGHSLSAEELATYVNSNAPYYFVPRYIEFVDSLPYTPTDKVQKYVLRERGVSAETWDRKAAGFELQK